MRTVIFSCIALAALFARPSAAEPMRPFQLDALADFHGGKSGVTTYGGRAYLGYAHRVARLSTGWQLYASAGAHLSVGYAAVEDRQAVDGTVTVRRDAIGAEGRVGFAYGGAAPKVYLYLGGGPVRASAANVTPNIAEAGSALGHRLSLGVAGRGSWKAIADELVGDSAGSDDDGDMLLVVAFLLPNTLEISMESFEGDTRFGAGLGWAF